MDQQIEQVHPEVVEVGEQVDFFAIARKVLPWVVLAFVLFRVGSLVAEFQGAQRAASRQSAEAAATTTLTAGQAAKNASVPATKTAAAARGPYVIVLSDGVNFHASASNSGKVLSSLKRGAELSQLGRVGNWLKLKDAGGTIGYVYDNPKFVAHKE